MKKFCLSLFLLSLVNTYAQTGNDNVFMSSDKIFTLGGKRAKSAEYKIDGNPYTSSKNFEQVIIDGYSKNVQDLRYNAYADEMEYLDKKDTYYADKTDGLTIVFPSLKKTYIVKNYTYMGNEKFGYLVLLSKKEAKYGLFKREKVELIPGEKSVNAFAKDANDYYAKEKDVYLVSKGNTFYRLPKNVDELSEDLSLDAKSVKEFAKSNKINFNKEEDLVKLFDFINK